VSTPEQVVAGLLLLSDEEMARCAARAMSYRGLGPKNWALFLQELDEEGQAELIAGVVYLHGIVANDE